MIFPDDEPPFTPLLNSGGDVKRDPAGRELSHHQSVQDHLKIKLMTMVMPFILQQVCFLNSNDDNFFPNLTVGAGVKPFSVTLRMKTVTMRLEEGILASSCFCNLNFASINFNREPASTVGNRMLENSLDEEDVFVINIT